MKESKRRQREREDDERYYAEVTPPEMLAPIGAIRAKLVQVRASPEYRSASISDQIWIEHLVANAAFAEKQVQMIYGRLVKDIEKVETRLSSAGTPAKQDEPRKPRAIEGGVQG